MLRFDNTYARLPPRFFARVSPATASAPALLKLNEDLARELGLDPDDLRAEVDTFAGNVIPDGAEPLAMAYAGHQFGGFVPQLGDGRAILLGEVVSPGGVRYDLHLKGAGRTPFSRGGDGRNWIGPVLREYLVSEAMHRLEIPTTRALAAVTTGEPVYREVERPGAVLTRVARGHVRVGTFQYFAVRGDLDAVRALADYALLRLGPEPRAGENPYRALLDAVLDRQAELVAQWMSVGFIHGVMNTDNCAISGETLDYGPCAFMDDYHPDTVFSSIDRHGRYAFNNQPSIARWNVARLAETLLPLLDDDEDAAVGYAQRAIDAFPGRFERAWLARFRPKLGLLEARDDDAQLIRDLLDAMKSARADFTNTFRALARAVEGDDADVQHLDPTWRARWIARLADEPMAPAERADAMRARSPAVIPRNHQVEAALDAALRGDLSRFDALEAALASPYEETEDNAPYRVPPEPDEVVEATFCGT